MKKLLMTLTAVGVGAGAMYFADARSGRRRRARVRAAVDDAADTIRETAASASREAEERFTKITERTKATFGGPRRSRWEGPARLVAGAAGIALLAVASRQRPLARTAAGVAAYELIERALRAARTAA